MSSRSEKSRACSGGVRETGNLVLGGKLEGEVLVMGSIVNGGERGFGGEPTGCSFLETSSVCSNGPR